MRHRRPTCDILLGIAGLCAMVAVVSIPLAGWGYSLARQLRKTTCVTTAQKVVAENCFDGPINYPWAGYAVFAYRVEELNKTRTGQQQWLCGWYKDATMRAMKRDYPAGTSWTGYYNTHHPEQVQLYGDRDAFPMLVIGLVFFVLGLLCVVVHGMGVCCFGWDSRMCFCCGRCRDPYRGKSMMWWD